MRLHRRPCQENRVPRVPVLRVVRRVLVRDARTQEPMLYLSMLRYATVAVASTMVATGTFSAPSAAAASAYGTSGVCKRVKAGLAPSLGTSSYADDSGASVYGASEGLAEDGLDLRVLRRAGQIRGLALCNGSSTAARLPLPRDRRARVVAVSVNGQRVAWRTTSRARGTLAVGRVSHRVVGGVRSTMTRALAGPQKGRQINDRFEVTPDGSVAWSLPVGTRAGVWLWPAGGKPRRVALTRNNDGGNASRDVRIVDRHHVLIGPGMTIARYGPRTPGSCPTGIGVTTVDSGPLEVRFSGGSTVEGIDESFSWEHLLVCDPAIGDYTRVIRFGGSSSGVGTTVGTSRGPTRVAFVAGTLVVERSTRDGFGGDYTIDHDALIVPRDASQPIRNATGGGIAGPGIVPPASYPSVGSGPAPQPVGVRVNAGALAWTEGDATNVQVGRPVWLSDAAGTRRVGTAFRRSMTAYEGNSTAPDVDLALDDRELSWNTSTSGGTARSMVSPTMDTAVAVAPIPR